MHPWSHAAASGVVALLGIAGFFVALAGREDAKTFKTVGVLATGACVFALFAALRRSWARLPLLLAAYIAGTMAWDGFFGTPDPSMLSPLLGYLLFDILLVALALTACVILSWGFIRPGATQPTS